MTGPIASTTQENEARKVHELIQTLQERQIEAAQIEETELSATSQAAIDFLKRQTFMAPDDQTVLHLCEPPVSLSILFSTQVLLALI